MYMLQDVLNLWSGVAVLRLVFVRSLELSTHYSDHRNWMGNRSVNGSK